MNENLQVYLEEGSKWKHVKHAIWVWMSRKAIINYRYFEEGCEGILVS